MCRVSLAKIGAKLLASRKGCAVGAEGGGTAWPRLDTALQLTTGGVMEEEGALDGGISERVHKGAKDKSGMLEIIDNRTYYLC